MGLLPKPFIISEHFLWASTSCLTLNAVCNLWKPLERVLSSGGMEERGVSSRRALIVTFVSLLSSKRARSSLLPFVDEKVEARTGDDLPQITQLGQWQNKGEALGCLPPTLQPLLGRLFLFGAQAYMIPTDVRTAPVQKREGDEEPPLPQHHPHPDAASHTPRGLLCLELSEAFTSGYEIWWAFSLTLRTVHPPQAPSQMSIF